MKKMNGMKIGSPRGDKVNCPQGKRGRPGAGAELVEAERGSACTSQQILDTNHKKIYNKKLSVSQISVRNATCDIELASDSLTNKLDAVH